MAKKKKLSHKRRRPSAKPHAVGVKSNMDFEMVFTKSDLPLLRKAVKALERV